MDSALESADQPAGSVVVARENGRTVILLAGEVDAGLAAELHRAADTAVALGLPVLVHCGSLQFIDSTGLSFLARLTTAATTPPVVYEPPQMLTLMLRTTGMLPLFDVR